MAERIELDTAAFGAVVVFFRTLWGWTQQELAEACGTNKSRVSDWENGKQMPRSGSVRKLASAFHAPEGALTGLQQVILTYIRNHSADFDSLLRDAKSLRSSDEVREPEPSWIESERSLIRIRWQELARDMAALEERKLLLERDTLLESFRDRSADSEPG